MLRTVIVDDEKHCCDLLFSLLKDTCEDVEVVGVANNIDDAQKLIDATHPDLVLLDIYLPPSNSFELLHRYKEIFFEIIFTTAFSDYAIEAIKQSPVDYLLKPVDPDELYEAIKKVKKKVFAPRAVPGNEKKIFLHTDRSFIIVSIHDILRIESEDKGTVFTLKNKTVYRTNKGISEFENLLRTQKFFRTHRSHIINMDEVREYIPEKNGGCIVMSDGKLIPLAIRRKDDFLMYFIDDQA